MTRPIEALPRGDFSPGSSRPGGTRAPAAGGVKEGYIYDQTYRGSASRGLQSPFLPVPLSGAHRFFPIIAQDFSPGSLAGRPKVVKADKVCDQIFKEVIVYDQGPRVSTLGGLARRPWPNASAKK